MGRPLDPSETGRTLSGPESETISLKVLRRQFLAQPATKQAATLAYVRRLLSERPTSYLARHAAALYGPMTQDEARQMKETTQL